MALLDSNGNLTISQLFTDLIDDWAIKKAIVIAP
jgi:hypothetical protein